MGLGVNDSLIEYLALCMTLRESSESSDARACFFPGASLKDGRVSNHLKALITRYGYDPDVQLVDFAFKRPRV